LVLHCTALHCTALHCTAQEGLAGLTKALERELGGIRCEISVIANKIRWRSAV
jgi:hypothetical protein